MVVVEENKRNWNNLVKPVYLIHPQKNSKFSLLVAPFGMILFGMVF
jgi:hypothetical protein